MRIFLFLFLLAFSFIMSEKSLAKCAEMKAFYCVPAIFEQEMPELNFNTYGKQFCSGKISLPSESVTAVFLNKDKPCPQRGTRLMGHLRTLCQDTGEWTKATYQYSEEPEFCLKSFHESWSQAQTMAANIHSDLTRAQVRELLKDYVFLRGSFTEEYYLHPDVVLEVTFDEPNGAYNLENKVKGTALVKKVVLSDPVSPVEEGKSMSAPEEFIDCGCGCCGGNEPQNHCLYKAKGDSLTAKILEIKTNAPTEEYCSVAGCSIGMRYYYCD